MSVVWKLKLCVRDWILGYFSIPNDGYLRYSYSQVGEDAIVDRFFHKKYKGFYVDVGAHHPARFSNTYAFYLRGWNGINIDACPGSMKLFEENRPRDINLELAVAPEEGELVFDCFDEPAFNRIRTGEGNSEGEFDVGPARQSCVVKALPLSEILSRHMPENAPFDILSIDVEGLDVEVLKSNNWERYKPRIIMIEDWRVDASDAATSASFAFLQEKGYALEAVSSHTLIFVERHSF